MASKLFEHKVERSHSSHAILEVSSRKRKAQKIIALLEEVTDVKKSEVLDIGTGSGNIAHELSLAAKKICSIDIVDERKEKKGYIFKIANSELIPFKDSQFDIVISNHVIEHTPDQDMHVKEMLRVVKPGGFIYIATPNKYWLTDPHYKLPFISWMPRSLSDRYLKLTQNKMWDVYPLSPLKLKKYFSNNSKKTINALPFLLKGEASKKLDTWVFLVRISKHIPVRILSLTQYFSPTLIFIFEKKD